LEKYLDMSLKICYPLPVSEKWEQRRHEMIKFKDTTDFMDAWLPFEHKKPVPGTHERIIKKRVSITEKSGLVLNKGMTECVKDNQWKAARLFWNPKTNQVGLWFWKDKQQSGEENKAYSITFYPKSARISARSFVEEHNLFSIIKGLGRTSFVLKEHEENSQFFIATLE